jgi:hypothetical protein
MTRFFEQLVALTLSVAGSRAAVDFLTKRPAEHSMAVKPDNRVEFSI